MKKNLKNKIIGAVAVVFLLLLGIVFGRIMIDSVVYTFSETLSYDSPLAFLAALYAFAFISITASVFINVIFHEVGHLIGGLLSGYSFLSLRVGDLMLQKNNNKLELKKAKLPGTLGQCIMNLPDKDFNDIPYFLYNFLGGGVNLITAVITFLLSFIVTNPLLLGFMNVFALFALIMGLQNLIPLKFNGFNNDGMNILELSKNKETKINFFKVVKIYHLNLQGTALCDLDKELLTINEGSEKKDALSAAIYTVYLEKLLQEKKYEECIEKTIEFLKDNSAVNPIHKIQMIANQIFCMIMLKKEKVDIDKLITKEYKKIATSMKNYPTFIRTAYALAVFDNDANSMNKQQKLFLKAVKFHPNKSDIIAEEIMINDVVNLYKD